MTSLLIAAGPDYCLVTQPNIQVYTYDGWCVHHCTSYGLLQSTDDMGLRFDTDTLASDEEAITSIVFHPEKILLRRGLAAAAPVLYRVDQDRSQVVVADGPAAVRAVGATAVADDGVLAEHLAYGFLVGGRSYLRGYRSLAPGQQVTIRRSDGRLVLEEYWQSPIFSHQAISALAVESLDGFIANLRQHTVNSRLLFSGGVDSSVLAALLPPRTEADPVPLALSAGYWFEGEQGIESIYARTGAEALNLVRVHYHLLSSADSFLMDMIEATLASGAPPAGLQSVLVYGILRYARCTGMQPLMVGQGADALFGTPPSPSWTEHELGEAVDQRQAKWIMDFLGCARTDIMGPRRELIEELADSGPPIRHWRLYQLQGYTDKGMSGWGAMADTLNLRLIYPFLLTPAQNLSRQSEHVHVGGGKQMLRRVAVTLDVPRFIIDRPKASFGPSSTDWASELTPLFRYAEYLVGRHELLSLVADPKYRFLLWNLITYGIWRHVCFSSSYDHQ